MNTRAMIESIRNDPENNRVGVVALSMPSVKERKRWVESALEILQQLGLRVEVGRSVFAARGYKSAPAKIRACDLQSMLENPRIRMILNTTGGYNSNEVLERIEFSRLAKVREKLFVGYSDITAVNLALYSQTKVRVIQGPMLVDCSQEPGCYRRLFEELGSARDDLTTPPQIWEWDKRANSAPRLRCLAAKRATARGRLVAGNLSTFNLMLGTQWMPALNDAVLFLEYDKEEARGLPSLERLLWQLRLAGCFERLSGLVFGALPQEVRREENPIDSIERILTAVTQGYRFPVVYDAPFGHLYPSWYLPLGSGVRIAARRGRCRLEITR